MKKIRSYILITFLSTVVVILLFVTMSSKSVKNIEEQKPYVSSLTVAVAPPDYVEFCGEKISLERLDMRERYDREINTFTYFHATTMLYIKRANRFFPIIEPILKKHNIPDDLKYLCVIESGLDTRALSPAKAAGLWQFIESTGKSYGLEIRDGVDERYNVEKATEAACKYFKDAYDRYGDWVNVAASYNAGMGRITSQLSQQYVESAFDLHLVSETSRYVFRIMAAKQIFMNPQKYGFVLKKENLYPAINFNYVEVTSSIADLAAFAKQNNITYMQLKDYNVWLRDTKLVVPSGKTYRIAIPKKEDTYFNKNKLQVHDSRWVVD
ncbi:membrane-bound lytic murein transglycosylase D [Dysgonomonadaceae bacterium PH5-43]|nr:membrane-bound lytic murein transglycosylase D [Dysgonomonadaceae bacterium PH5-43]